MAAPPLATSSFLASRRGRLVLAFLLAVAFLDLGEGAAAGLALAATVGSAVPRSWTAVATTQRPGRKAGASAPAMPMLMMPRAADASDETNSASASYTIAIGTAPVRVNTASLAGGRERVGYSSGAMAGAPWTKFSNRLGDGPCRSARTW